MELWWSESFGLRNDSQVPKELPPKSGEYVPRQWAALAERVCAGEKVSHIAREIGVGPPCVRAKVLRAFKRRNPVKYSELRRQRDYGCQKEPSMRLLVANCGDFGFPQSPSST